MMLTIHSLQCGAGWNLGGYELASFLSSPWGDFLASWFVVARILKLFFNTAVLSLLD